jgi:hypothetical protein
MSTDSKDSAVFQEGDDGEFVRVNSNDLWIRREKKEKKDKKPRKYPRPQQHDPSAEGGAIGVVGIILVFIAVPAFIMTTNYRNEMIERVIAGVVLFFVALGALGSCALVIAFDKLKVLTDQNKKLRARVHELEEKAGVSESNKKKSV